MVVLDISIPEALGCGQGLRLTAEVTDGLSWRQVCKPPDNRGNVTQAVSVQGFCCQVSQSLSTSVQVRLGAPLVLVLDKNMACTLSQSKRGWCRHSQVSSLPSLWVYLRSNLALCFARLKYSEGLLGVSKWLLWCSRLL